MWNMYIYTILPVSQSYQEPPGVSWNYCACPITRLIYQGLPKVMLILWLMHFALVNQLEHCFSYICIAISVSNRTFIVVRINDTHTLIRRLAGWCNLGRLCHNVANLHSRPSLLCRWNCATVWNRKTHVKQVGADSNRPFCQWCPRENMTMSQANSCTSVF